MRHTLSVALPSARPGTTPRRSLARVVCVWALMAFSGRKQASMCFRCSKGTRAGRTSSAAELACTRAQGAKHDGQETGGQ